MDDLWLQNARCIICKILPLEQYADYAVKSCGIISKIKVLLLKIKVYMKNVAVFPHWGKARNQKELWGWNTDAAGMRGIH